MMRLLYISLGLAVLTQSANAADIESGKNLFAQRCATCHGTLGAGDGPVAQGLPADQKPRNLISGEMKFATDDEKLKKVLKEGGQAVGLSPLMPPQPDLSQGDIDSLALFVKSLKK